MTGNIHIKIRKCICKRGGISRRGLTAYCAALLTLPFAKTYKSPRLMRNEDLAVPFLAIIPAILDIADVNPWLVFVSAIAASTWAIRQIYLSFKTEKRNQRDEQRSIRNEQRSIENQQLSIRNDQRNAVKHMLETQLLTKQLGGDWKWWSNLDHTWQQAFNEAIGKEAVTDMPNPEDLKKIVSLKKVACPTNQITDLSPLDQLKHLEELNCSTDQINEDQIRNFKEQHPNCKIIYTESLT